MTCETCLSYSAVKDSEFIGFCKIVEKLVPRFDVCEDWEEIGILALNEFGYKIVMMR